jgi:hypothetical protein
MKISQSFERKSRSNLNVNAVHEFLILSVPKWNEGEAKEGTAYRNPTQHKLSISAAMLLRLLIFLE